MYYMCVYGSCMHILFIFYHNTGTSKDRWGYKTCHIARNANATEIQRQALELFFPEGTSRKGVLLHTIDISVCDFGMSEIDDDTTVGDFYEKVKPSGILRFYLVTSEKNEQVEDRNENRVRTHSRDIPHPGLRTQSADRPNAAVDVGEKTNSADKTHAGVRDITHSEDRTHSGDIHVSHSGDRTHSGELKKMEEMIDQHPGPSKTIDCDYQNITLSDENNNSDKTKSFKTPVTGYYPVINGGVNTKLETINVLYEGNGERRIREITNMSKCFIRRPLLADSVQMYELPSRSTALDADEILITHHPDEVYGLYKNKLVLGVISTNHDAVSFQWYLNGKELLGEEMCLHEVQESGNYSCQVKASVSNNGQLEDVSRMSKSIVKLLKVRILKPAPLLVGREVPNSREVAITDLSVNYQEAINQGSFGEVFKATMRDGKTVALKRIKMKRGKRPETMINKEAEIHRNLHHQNIVRFIGTCMDINHVYIITEYVAGQNLEELIFSVKFHEVNIQTKISIAQQMVDAVSYLHEHSPQIIHQDIKPANVLISIVNDSLTAKLCDLGLARIRSADLTSKTSLVPAAGTPEYMAPEVLLIRGKATSATDVRSAGITLIELFSGMEAWLIHDQEDEPIDLLKEYMNRKKTPISLKYIIDDSIISSCLSYDASYRPSASQLLARLMCPSCSGKLSVSDIPDL